MHDFFKCFMLCLYVEDPNKQSLHFDARSTLKGICHVLKYLCERLQIKTDFMSTQIVTKGLCRLQINQMRCSTFKPADTCDKKKCLRFLQHKTIRPPSCKSQASLEFVPISSGLI